MGKAVSELSLSAAKQVHLDESLRLAEQHGALVAVICMLLISALVGLIIMGGLS